MTMTMGWIMLVLQAAVVLALYYLVAKDPPARPRRRRERVAPFLRDGRGLKQNVRHDPNGSV